MSAAFTLRGVTFRYPPTKGEEARDALAGVDLDIPAGAVTAILGHSGSGKTTLLSLLGLLWEDVRPPLPHRLAGGLLRRLLRRGPPAPSGLVAGEVAFHDGRETHPYAGLSGDARARFRREHFGFVLQSSYLLSHFTCLQNVEIPLALAGKEEADRKKVVEARLEALGLGHKAGHSARDTSGGEQQRLAVLRAVLHDPRVVFADEPTGSLDPVNRRLVMDMLRDWQKEGEGRSLLLVSHDIPTAWNYADHFVLLRDGRVAEGGILAGSDLTGPEDIERRIRPEREGPA